jgi:omega-6 fatty acid desaturase (delta-12 desaturase)
MTPATALDESFSPAEKALPAAAAKASRRPEKELLIASKAFTVESKARGWAYTLSSMAILAGLTLAAVLLPWWWARLAFSLVEGLTIVRVFCLFHDFQHGAILRGSKLAQLVYFLFGEAILVPPSVWRETHNYHHAHTAKIVGSHIGSYPVVTTAMWKDMTKAQRTLYKLVRHPVNMLLAVLTVFSIGMCLKPFFRAPGKHWAGLVSFLFVYGSGAALCATGHGDAFLFGWAIPMWLAAMTGAYLFYAQHNFPGAAIASRQDWTFTGAALDASSYWEMNPVMHWFTANIGYHHVHHLNAAIPFYRLAETMAALPELQNPGKTSWAHKDIAAAFELKLWDAEAGKLVGYPS